jgi:hypothetical protein
MNFFGSKDKPKPDANTEKKEEIEAPTEDLNIKVDVDPFAGSRRKFESEDEYVIGKVEAKFRRDQRELYEMAMLMEGFL